MGLVPQSNTSGSATKLFAALHLYKRILVVGHIRPDGDAVGSCLAMTHLLRGAGIDAYTAINPAMVGAPKFLLKGLPKGMHVTAASSRRKPDAVLLLDCNALKRTEESVQKVAEGLPLFCLDHHCFQPETLTPFTAHWNRSEASSTGELVYEFAVKNKLPLDALAARALWVAVITDTGRFAYSCTKPSTLRMAAALLEQGVDTAAINDIIYLYQTQAVIAIKRRAYDSLQTACDGQVAWIALGVKDFRATGVNKTDIEDIVDLPRSVATAQIALFFYETPEKLGVTRVSIRTRGNYDATRIAEHFGGGGHFRAAGCDVPGSLVVGRRKMLAFIETLMA